MDKVGDLLIRIKNGYMASLKEVSAPRSKLSAALCELLKKKGFIEKFEVLDEQSSCRNNEQSSCRNNEQSSCRNNEQSSCRNNKEIKITLKYENRKPVLTDVKRVSKPGRRVYKGKHLLPRVYGGLGIAIISTPRGVMSDDQARKEGLGGEVMALVW